MTIPTAKGEDVFMLYMVLEKFKEGAAPKIYQRARDRGRLLPQGLYYVSSWVDLDLTRCFQLMETSSPSLIDAWIKEWADLVEFEIVPVQTSAEAAQASNSANEQSRTKGSS